MGKSIKLELTKQEIKAVKDSVKHWKNDIQKRLENGDKIIVNTNKVLYLLKWQSNKYLVKCLGNSCPLCIYTRTLNKAGRLDCSMCPYYKKYDCMCTILHWADFIHNPNLRTCNSMIKALKDIWK